MLSSFAVTTLFALLLLGCNSPEVRPSLARNGETIYSPIMAIEAAARMPMGLHATFELQVKRANYGVDAVKGLLFLNSEEDYRDRRCLTIRIPPASVRAFLKKNIDPARLFKNKKIRVKGVAEQVKIYFVSDSGIESDKYYYQTHIVIHSPDQISILPD